MATEGAVRTQSMIAGADYSADGNDYKIVKIDTAAADTVTLVAVLGARADAIMTNKPPLGKPAVLVEDGYGKARCGAAITSAGLELTPDATGRLITAVSTNFVFAISRNSTAAAGEFVGVKIVGPYIKA
jgi:hypothetical protein